ncbi:hypothetical protein EGM85_12225, partial [Macrococcus caseolyticus]
QINTMSAANKILNQDPSDLELKIDSALVELENNAEFKADIRAFQFKSAREIPTGQGKYAIVIFVPVPQLIHIQKAQQKQQRLIRELEKKFADRHIVFLGERRILPKPDRKGAKQSQKRPRSRTLSAVHDAILEDLVYPTDIVGKRCRYQVGGNKLHKVYLDPKDFTSVDYKVDSFQAVYSKLTGKQVTFEVGTKGGVH